jgi:hypothetical protein
MEVLTELLKRASQNEFKNEEGERYSELQISLLSKLFTVLGLQVEEIE